MANRNFDEPFYGINQEMAFPGHLALSAKGVGVQRVQEWLIYNHLHVDVDRDYGPGTKIAVADFQATHGLPRTGEVDETTWDLLIRPLKTMMAPVQAANVREAIVAFAKQHAGVHPVEIGGPNDGPFVRSVMLGNGGKEWQWCAGNVCFILAQAFRQFGFTSLPFVPSFGVPQMVRSAQNRHIFMPDGPAQPGDVFVIPTTESWCHTGIVTSWSLPKFGSYEGNTNEAGGSDGTCARECLRTASRCDFIRVI